jgi:sugar phosphate isomerase/epimerase
VIYHIKDFIVENNALKQCCIGKGIMNYDYMIPKIKKYSPNSYLIFEGSKPEDMQFSYEFIKKKLGE